MNSQTYLEQEQSRQFSQEKMDQSNDGLGLSKQSENIKRLAQIKGFNVKKCQVCNEPVITKDIREVVTLCHEHMGLKSIVSNMLGKRKRTNLTQEDISSLAKSRNVRTGPFFNIKDPTGELRKNGIIK